MNRKSTQELKSIISLQEDGCQLALHYTMDLSSISTLPHYIHLFRANGNQRYTWWRRSSEGQVSEGQTPSSPNRYDSIIDHHSLRIHRATQWCLKNPRINAIFALGRVGQCTMQEYDVFDHAVHILPPPSQRCPIQHVSSRNSTQDTQRAPTEGLPEKKCYFIGSGLPFLGNTCFGESLWKLPCREEWA